MTTLVLEKPKPILASDRVKIGSNAEFNVPVESFGKNILGKLGWKENANIPIGRAKEGVEYQEPDFKNLMPRQSRLGLGAKPLTNEEIKKLNKNKNGPKIMAGGQ